MKVKSQGDIEWTMNCCAYSYCAQQTSDGNYIVIGGEESEGIGIYCGITKTNQEGDAIWFQGIYGQWGAWSINPGEFIQETQDGGYIFTGKIGLEIEEMGIQLAIWLQKTDSVGNMVWSRQLGGEYEGAQDNGYCVKETNDRGFIIVGERTRSLWLLKTDSLGDTVWTKTFNGTGYSVQQTQDGGYIVAGRIGSFVTSFNPWRYDLLLLKTDSLGDTLWTRKYPDVENGTAIGYCVQQTSDGGFLVVGELNGDIYFLKTDSLGLLGISEPYPVTHPSLPGFELVQPIGPTVTLRYSNYPGGFRASVYDAGGRRVDELRAASQTGTITWGEGTPPGVYFIKVESGAMPEVQKFVIIK